MKIKLHLVITVLLMSCLVYGVASAERVELYRVQNPNSDGINASFVIKYQSPPSVWLKIETDGKVTELGPDSLSDRFVFDDDSKILYFTSGYGDFAPCGIMDEAGIITIPNQNEVDLLHEEEVCTLEISTEGSGDNVYSAVFVNVMFD